MGKRRGKKTDKKKTPSQRKRAADAKRQRTRERNKMDKLIKKETEILKTSRRKKEQEAAAKALCYAASSRKTLVLKNTLLELVAGSKTKKKHKNWVVRWYAVIGLERFKLGEKGLNVLRETAKNDESPAVKKAAQNAIRIITEK
jgi:hypothetical protein